MTGLFDNLTDEQRTALDRIVSDWVADGFTTPPYDAAYYDIFEALGTESFDYDLTRPTDAD